MNHRVYITRKIPDNGIKMLREKGYEIDVNDKDRSLSHDELKDILKSKEYDAVLTLLNDRIDSSVLDASPKTKIFANFTIGYDNFDVEEAKKRGVFMTNAPGGGATTR
jgi:glyoxylate reductase